ncbi:MAG: membrane protease subunit (stomatin/prohibitin family) [Parvicellaceae bacterium]|jgi:membrane protease subunit (stomatin/prohibitin family)
MGLWDKLKNELIDIIEFMDDSGDTLVHRFDRYQNEIKNGAQLTVRPGQVAVFINEGQIADVYQPGKHRLETANMPILSTLKGWKHGFNSPFKAEVLFVKTTQMTDQKWGTKNPITLSDPRFGMFDIRAFGTYALKVTDAPKFITEVVGTDPNFTVEEITGQLRSLVVTRTSDAIAETELPVEKYASNLNEISADVHGRMTLDFESYGLSLATFFVENISMPDDIKKEIFELSRLTSQVDLDKLTKLKTAKAIEKAAENEGMAGGGMGMGMGFAMANTMGQTLGGAAAQPAQQPAPAAAGAPAPPPLPAAMAFHAVINGAQAGPFDMATIKQMIGSNQFLKETLVWKEGMAGWVAASSVNELTSAFGSVPPPLPPA